MYGASSILVILSLSLSLGCTSVTIVPLHGDDPEVVELLGRGSPPSVGSSPKSAARRLHQAVGQRDTALIWTLLNQSTRTLLEGKGSSLGISGQGLLDASIIPDMQGSGRKVGLEEFFFGTKVVDLDIAPTPSPETGQSIIRFVSSTGQIVEREFVREEDGWKLKMTTFGVTE